MAALSCVWLCIPAQKASQGCKGTRKTAACSRAVDARQVLFPRANSGRWQACGAFNNACPRPINYSEAPTAQNLLGFTHFAFRHSAGQVTHLCSPPLAGFGVESSSSGSASASAARRSICTTPAGVPATAGGGPAPAGDMASSRAGLIACLFLSLGAALIGLGKLGDDAISA